MTWIRQIYKTKSEQITKYIILITPFSENCSLLYKGKKMTTVINIPVFLLYFWKKCVSKCLKKKERHLKFPQFLLLGREWPLVNLWLYSLNILPLLLRIFWFPREPRGTQVPWCSSRNTLSCINNKMPIIQA